MLSIFSWLYKTKEERVKEGSMLYMGTWYDFEVTDHYREVKKFIFVDGQPRTEFFPENGIEKYEPEMYRHQFIEEILENSKKSGFTLKSTHIIDPGYVDKFMSDEEKRINSLPHLNPEKWIFENEERGQIVHYYISTLVPLNVSEDLEKDIETCDKLYVSGYHPPSFFLKNIQKPFIFIASTETCYRVDNDDNYQKKDNICHEIVYNPEVKSMICNYVLFDKKNKRKMKMKNFEEIQTKSYENWYKNVFSI
jgi:hypothetical protein